MTATRRRRVRLPLIILLLLVALAPLACQGEQENFEMHRYSVDERSTNDGMTVSVNQVLFRPGYNVSEGVMMNERGASGEPTWRIEGNLRNESSEPAKVYLVGAQQARNAVLQVQTPSGESLELSASLIRVDGAQYVKPAAEGQRNDHYLVPAGAEFPLIVHIPAEQFDSDSELTLTVERVEFAESGAVEQFRLSGIELGESETVEFDPFNAPW